MAAVAVERPVTAQERVLSSNNPPPPPPKAMDIGHRQRAAANSRGTNIVQLFRGDDKDAATQELSCLCVTSGKKTQHLCPSDFLSGPKEPGHVKRGVRRFDEKNECLVAKALTEEWILGRPEDEPIPPPTSRQRGPRDNLDGLCCRVKTEEAKQRKMRAPGNAPPHTTMAPYSVPELGIQVQEKQKAVGKRRFNLPAHDNVMNYGDQVAPEKSSGDQQPQAGRTRRNRANESVNVLNLGQYSGKQLNETERKIMLGPREFVPEPLPPRQRPLIARVHTHANETHDIFGTGRGVQDVEVLHRKNPGVSAPKRSEAVNIFEMGPAERKSAQPPKPRDERPRPATSDPAARQCLGKVDQGVLFESKSPVVASRGGRNRGVYAPKSTTNLLL